MQVLLLERIDGLGDIGDEVRVRPGYGRNYLVPQNKALPASEENRKRMESRLQELKQRQAALRENNEARAAALGETLITVTARCGPEGRLHGSVGAGEICSAAARMGLALDQAEVRLPAGRLVQTGEHEIEARLGPDRHVAVRVSIIPNTDSPD